MEATQSQSQEVHRRDEEKRVYELTETKHQLRQLKEELSQKAGLYERAKEEAIELKFQLKEANMRGQHATESLQKAESELGELRRKHDTMVLRVS